MEKKENVCGETAQTESAAEAVLTARENLDGGIGNSAALGKFKNVDALAKAYTALQAEFTRRSQRLKELERASENFSKENEERTKLDASTRSGVEKLRENASARKVEEKAFETFVAELGKGKQPTQVCDETLIGYEKPMENADGNAVFAKETEVDAEAKVETEAEASLQEKGADKDLGELKKEGTETTPNKVAGSFVAKSRESLETSEELYARVSRDENVRLRIIGEYLSSLKKAGAPLMTTGAGTFVTPPLKAKSIQEAGSLALQFFQRGER